MGVLNGCFDRFIVFADGAEFVALSGKDGDLGHIDPQISFDIGKLRAPFGDHGVAIHPDIQDIKDNVFLFANHFGDPIIMDRFSADTSWFMRVVVGRIFRKDRAD